MRLQQLSSIVGWLARCERPAWLVRYFQRWFIRTYRVDTAEMQGTLENYKSVAALFARPLREGLRPVQSRLVCPVDGRLRSIDQVRSGQLLQVKGKNYQVERLLGSAEWARYFEGGLALNFYLSPQDYHRIHMPLAARLLAVEYLPGYLWPVNNWALHARQGLFSDNERVLALLEQPQAMPIGSDQRAPTIAMVLVGALNVGAISLTSVPHFPPVVHGRLRERKDFAPPLELALGAEFGAFALGSSVLLLFPPGYLEASKIMLQAGAAVRVGQAICAEEGTSYVRR